MFYVATANTNEKELVKGWNYIIESNHNGTVNVYHIHNMMLNFKTIHRIDGFDNWKEIE
jgi:hypothetical protein